MTPEKLKLDIELLLPDVEDEKDSCVTRLISELQSKTGVAEAHVDMNGGARLCVHYDPNLLSVHRIRELAETAGAALTNEIGHITWRMQGVRHERHARRLESEIRRIEGVMFGSVSATGAVRVEFERSKTDENRILAGLKQIGLVAVESAADEQHTADKVQGDQHGNESGHGHDHAHGIFGERTEMIFAVLSCVLLASGFLISRFSDVSTWVSNGAYWAAFGFGAWFTTIEAIQNLKDRRFEIDTLMIVAAVGAAALGNWAEGALLLALFSLGHALENYAMGRAKKAIEALAAMSPKTAHVMNGDGNVTEVGVDELKAGQSVLVKPNERIPVDGVVTTGTSSVNQAPVTGESVPVDKSPLAGTSPRAESFATYSKTNVVFAGSINGTGVLEIFVVRAGRDSTLGRIVDLINSAETEKSPTQRVTDRFEKLFVPAVLIGVLLLLFAFVVIDEPFSASFYRAMAVLVAASPCALAISTPSAVLSGIARAGRMGVLVKNGAALENLGTTQAMAFDKTGTLTEGKPRLTDVIVGDGVSEEELLGFAYAIESQSDHPLARAVVDGVTSRSSNGSTAPKRNSEKIEAVVGRGVRGRVDGRAIEVGKLKFFTERGSVPESIETAVEKLEAGGRTIMVVKAGDQFLGVLGIMDRPREKAKAALAALKTLGVQSLIMISGDNRRAASAIASEVGLTDAIGDLLPEDKVSKIKELRARHTKVAMIGDGVNDAPAMASATVGIAMGAAGSDVALETADVALMADDLAKLPHVVGLSRKASAIIKQNLWISLGAVALLVPATLSGLGIGPAVVVHEGSTLVVVVNALRLLAYKTDE